MKRIRLSRAAQADVRAIDQPAGMRIHRVRNRKQGLSLRGARMRLRQVLRLLPVCHRVFITVQGLKWPWEVE